MRAHADARLYASAVALVSGVYSIGSAIAGMETMPMSDAVMLLVGIAAIGHGTILLTPLAETLGRTGGPLMILWAALMLANQLLAATMSGSMRVSWDAGMVALAILMLASGLIMSRRGGPM